MSEEANTETKGFETLAEWTIRRLRPLEDLTEEGYTERVKRWVLYSIGLETIHQNIFLYLEEKLRSTTTDIASEFKISPNTARKYLDELHTVGLVDYIGREYTLTYNSLSRAIELMLIPRITDTLRTIASGASSTGFTPYSFTPESLEGEVVNEKNVPYINQKVVEEWYSRGKKVRVHSMSSMTIAEDVDPELLDSVVVRIEAMGSVDVPEKMFDVIVHKIRTMGSINKY
jgi:DNA-binding transcriptional regulator YhcF (GntR family)